jgi:hypothetical protein
LECLASKETLPRPRLPPPHPQSNSRTVVKGAAAGTERDTETKTEGGIARRPATEEDTTVRRPATEEGMIIRRPAIEEGMIIRRPAIEVDTTDRLPDRDTGVMTDNTGTRAEAVATEGVADTMAGTAGSATMGGGIDE